MGLYKVELKKSAFKELQSLDKKVIPAVWKRIKKLSQNPKPVNSIKLFGAEASYRIRVGNYRVIYQIDERARTVTIYRIRHRKEAYR